MYKYTVQHFKPREFACRCCGELKVSPLLVLWLDQLRHFWGSPVLVNSGYRCEQRNAEVGGTEKSRHLLGCAADIRVNEHTGEFINITARHFDRPGWEVKVYPTFVHVAVPRAQAPQNWMSEVSADVVLVPANFPMIGIDAYIEI